MNDAEEYSAYVVVKEDNVATVLMNANSGDTISLSGNALSECVIARENIARGFKIALRDIEKNELIIKYGIPIGKALVNISKGSCVHIHNMISLTDTRVQNYDTSTAVPKDRKYVLDSEI